MIFRKFPIFQKSLKKFGQFRAWLEPFKIELRIFLLLYSYSLNLSLIFKAQFKAQFWLFLLIFYDFSKIGHVGIIKNFEK